MNPRIIGSTIKQSEEGENAGEEEEDMVVELKVNVKKGGLKLNECRINQRWFPEPTIENAWFPLYLPHLFSPFWWVPNLF